MSYFKNLSPQTKSFLILFVIALVGTYLTTFLIQQELMIPQAQYISRLYSKNASAGNQLDPAAENFMAPFLTLDTSSWKTYADRSLGLSFKYNPSWKVSADKTAGNFDVLNVNPGTKYYDMKIYVSNTGFYELDGLPYVETEINGIKAFNVSNQLYGIRMGQRYYTFANGLSTNMISNFNTLVRTVRFQ